MVTPLSAVQNEGPLVNGDVVQGDVQDLFSCGKTYIGETQSRHETRLKDHWDACQRRMLERSAVAEHAWNYHQSIRWEEPQW